MLDGKCQILSLFCQCSACLHFFSNDGICFGTISSLAALRRVYRCQWACTTASGLHTQTM